MRDNNQHVFTYKDQIYRIEKLVDACKKSHEIELVSQLHLYDLLILTFQNVWHLKDWIKNDPFLTQDEKNRIVSEMHTSTLLRVAQQICNGSKHLNLDYTAKVTTEIHVPNDPSKDLDYIVDVQEADLGSRKVPGRDLLELLIQELKVILGENLWKNDMTTK